ncbi:MAG: DUF2059 domain-containing protein [Pseudomonadota bacterium]
MTRVVGALFAACLLAAPAAADPFERLMTAMKMDDAVDILVEEGRLSALELEDSMFPGRGGDVWVDEVARIYAPAPRRAELRAVMEPLLAETDLDPLLAFMESEIGQRIMTLEISARRAFMDPDMEALANDAFTDAEETRPRLYEQVIAFTEVNELVEANVEGAFRSNAAFAFGAHEAGAFAELTVDELITQMWAGEDVVRADIESWLFAYQMTAYAPLEAEELAAYIALSETEEGQALNAAIMGGFDALFADLSYDLGLAAGRFMAQQDL